ncbi:hypothetical protein TWF281_007856 [Arthrobotrys megalospora]
MTRENLHESSPTLYGEASPSLTAASFTDRSSSNGDAELGAGTPLTEGEPSTNTPPADAGGEASAGVPKSGTDRLLFELGWPPGTDTEAVGLFHPSIARLKTRENDVVDKEHAHERTKQDLRDEKSYRKDLEDDIQGLTAELGRLRARIAKLKSGAPGFEAMSLKLVTVYGAVLENESSIDDVRILVDNLEDLSRVRYEAIRDAFIFSILAACCSLLVVLVASIIIVVRCTAPAQVQPSSVRDNAHAWFF